MYIHKPKVVMRARVNEQYPDTYPRETINFDTVTLGDISLLRESMTVLLGSAPDKDDYGMVRYRYMDDLYPTSEMHVSRYSEGTGIGQIDLVDDSYITVIEDYRVWAKIPYMAGAAMWKDYDIGSYLNNGLPAPVPNGGPGTAGDIDPGTGRLEIAFDAQSFAFDLAFSPPVSNPQNYIWEIPGNANMVSGSLTSPTFTARFLPGFYYVYLTVHNEGLNHAETQKIPIFVRDPENDLSLMQFNVVSHNHDQIGQELTVELYSSLDRDLYYDGFLMMMWDDEIPYSPSSRNHMQFIGWHQADEVTIAAEDTATLDTTRLIFYDVGKRLTTLPGFTMVMEYVDVTGSDWSQTNFSNLLYYIWFILHFHSTVLEVADFFDHVHNLANYEFVVIGSDKQNLSAQVQEVAAIASPDYRMACNRQGQLKMIPDNNLQRVSARPTTVMDTLTDSNWTNVNWGYSHNPRIGQIQTKAFTSRNTYIIVGELEEIEIIACVAGEEYGQGEQLLESGKRIATNQTVLNEVEGNRFAKLNAKFAPFEITVPWELLERDVDPAEAKWLNLTIADVNHPIREATGFTNLRGTLLDMSINYQYGETGLIRMVTLHWEMETRGFPAKTVTLWPNS